MPILKRRTAQQPTEVKQAVWMVGLQGWQLRIRAETPVSGQANFCIRRCKAPALRDSWHRFQASGEGFSGFRPGRTSPLPGRSFLGKPQDSQLPHCCFGHPYSGRIDAGIIFGKVIPIGIENLGLDLEGFNHGTGISKNLDAFRHATHKEISPQFIKNHFLDRPGFHQKKQGSCLE